jgi:energy-coupling factor transporter ATP-binding protein EcfA2
MSTPPAEPGVLRTLSPALRSLERSLRGWLDSTHVYPVSMLHRAALEGLATDLKRQSDALDVDRPLLVIMLMGGTGVGKSTLLNALAGGTIAQAAVTRPTTRDPVVYYHESVRPDRLDPALRHCRLLSHDRPNLAQKVIVDTPDVDSTEVANRDKLLRLLPIADVVVYVGSQEKYHDQIGFRLFQQQRKRRAFAFVLNKWDRCNHTPGSTGVRPDEDLLHDLTNEGFTNPLLFRTCAQEWVNQKLSGQEGKPPGLPDGEQFTELEGWLENGLSRREIEAIKARGVDQLLVSLCHGLRDAAPPDLTEIAVRTNAAWDKPLREEAAASAEVLLNTLDPYQREIEHHFALEGQRRFRGLMAGYLYCVNNARYLGSSIRSHIPSVVPRTGSGKTKEPNWNLSMFTKACSEVAGNRQLDARSRALANRLLVDADAQGFPLPILRDPVESLAKIDWRQRYAQAMSETLTEIETTWTEPTGVRSYVQTAIVLGANWLPPIALLATLIVLLWRFFDPMGTGPGQSLSMTQMLVPVFVVLAVLVIMHLLIILLMPLRWAAIRNEFRVRLENRLRSELEGVYSGIPGDVAARLQEERSRVNKLVNDTEEVAVWLDRYEKSASVAGLYGS